MTVHYETLLLIGIVFFVVFLKPIWLFAHGSVESHDENHEIEHTVPEEPIPGAADFVQKLLEYGLYLCDEAASVELTKIGRLFSASTSSTPSVSAVPETESQAKKRTVAQNGLTQVVERIPHQVVPLDDFQRLSKEPAETTVPGATGCLLLKVSHPGKKIVFRVVELDLETFSEREGPIRLPITTQGTTWILAVLKRVPTGLTRQQVFYVAEENPSDMRLGFFEVKGTAQGEICVTIQDEDGTVTPALVRLVYRSTGALFPPGGAIDFGPQTGNIAGIPEFGYEQPTALRVAGAWAGLYWVTQGSFSNALPVGDWDIWIHRGVEYEPVKDSFTVIEGQKTVLDYRLSRWTDMRKKGWWSGDDHVHARLMSDEDARRLMTWARAADIHVTNILTMGDAFRLYYPQRGFGKDYRYQEGDRVLVPGQEDPRFYLGHTLGLNLKALVRDENKYLLSDWVADEIHRQGGLYGHAHISHYQLFNGERDLVMLMPLQKSDFGAIMQCNTLEPELYYKFLNLGFKLAASAGSDTPYGSSVGEVRVYAYLGDKPFDPDAWFDALKAGRTFVTNGPMIEFRVDGALPGDEIRCFEDKSLSVRVKSWGLFNQSAPKHVRLIRNGRCIQEVSSDNPGRTELELVTNVNCEYGGWLAVHVLGQDGSAAHTTPIYLIREGFRFWAIEEVPNLITWCKQILDSMETDMNRYIENARTGVINPYESSIAQAAADFKIRIAEVRGIYEELEKEYNEEIARRR